MADKIWVCKECGNDEMRSSNWVWKDINSDDIYDESIVDYWCEECSAATQIVEKDEYRDAFRKAQRN